MTALFTADEAARLTLGVNVIVRPGDLTLCAFCKGDGRAWFPDPPHWDQCPKGCPTFEHPQDWVALTGPCPTCKDSGWSGYVPADVSEMSGTALNDCGGGAPFKRCPNPDCRDGRRIVPLYTECEACGGDKNSASTCGVLDCFGGQRLVGRGSIEVVPVVETGLHEPYLLTGNPQWLILPGHDAYELALDPLPVPGRDFGVVIDVTELS